MRSDIITLVLAMAAHLVYYSFSDALDKAWCAYVLTGLLLAWIGWRDRGTATSTLALFTGSYIVIESGQVAVFGALAWVWGIKPTGQDLGLLLGGESIYAGLTALALAGAWTWRRTLWPSRQ